MTTRPTKIGLETKVPRRPPERHTRQVKQPESPDEFFQRMVKRPDIRTILEKLAKA